MGKRCPRIDGKIANSTRLMSTPMSLNTNTVWSKLKYLRIRKKSTVFSRKVWRTNFEKAFLRSFNSPAQQCIIYAFCSGEAFPRGF